jgi:phage-related protein
MSNFVFKLNRAGVRELMKSQEMQDVLKEHATTIKDRAGDGYEQDIYVGKNRANAMVRAETFKAKKDNSKNNTLLKAVHK